MLVTKSLKRPVYVSGSVMEGNVFRSDFFLYPTSPLLPTLSQISAPRHRTSVLHRENPSQGTGLQLQDVL